MSSYIQIIPSVLLLQLTTPTATYSSLITYSQKVLSVFPNSQTSDIQGPRYSGKGNECHRVRASSVCFSGVPLFAIPWTVAHRAPLSTRFSRQEYWSGLPFPSPFPWWSSGKDSTLPMQGIQVRSLVGELDATCCN